MAKKTPKKAPKKAAKKKSPSGAAELKAFKAAIQNLKATGSALANVAKKNQDLRSDESVRKAVDNAQTVAADIAKKIPLGPPHTTVFTG